MPKKADDVILNAVISALHKGENGTGKSIASGSKVLRPTYVIDCEDRMPSVINYYRNLDGHVKGLEFDTYSMGEGFYPVKKRLDELLSYCPYKTIACATLTSYVDIVLEHTKSSKQDKKNQTGGEAGKKIAGISVNTLEDYNAETAAITFELIKTLKQLQKKGINIILEAHVLTHEEKVGNVIRIARPLVTGGKKAAAKIPGYFNEVFHFYVDAEMSGATRYKVKTRHSGDDVAKTSFTLPDEIDWTGKDFYEELFKLLPEEIKNAPRSDPNEAPSGNW